MNRGLLTVAGTLGFSAVLLGAFGAHGLRDRLAPPLLEVYRTGVLYHLVHALAVLAVALAADRLRRPRRDALPARDHRADRAGGGDAARRPAAARGLGDRDRRGIRPPEGDYLSTAHSAAAVPTSMKVTRPTPATSLRWS